MANQEIFPAEVVQAFLADEVMSGMSASSLESAAVVPRALGSYEPVPVQTTNVATVQQGEHGTVLRVVESVDFYASNKELALAAYEKRLAHQHGKTQEIDKASNVEDSSANQEQDSNRDVERSDKRRYGWRTGLVLGIGIVGVSASVYGAAELYDWISPKDADLADFGSSILQYQFGVE